MRGVTPKYARSHPKICEESPQPLQGVTPTTARSHPNHCKESPQPLQGVTPTTARIHPISEGGMASHQFFKNISSLLRCAILKSSIYFDIGFKLNGKFFSTYESL